MLYCQNHESNNQCDNIKIMRMTAIDFDDLTLIKKNSDDNNNNNNKITMTTTYCDDLTGRKAVFAGEAYTALPEVCLKIKFIDNINFE